MKTIVQKIAFSSFLLLVLLLGAIPAHGLDLANFEAPAYIARAAINGQDGWTGAGTVTPDPLGSGYTFALAGSQSLLATGTDTRKYFSSVGATAADIYRLNWLQGTPDAINNSGTYQGLYLINALNQTPAGIVAKNVGGTVNIWLSGNSEFDTGVAYLTGGGGAPTVNNIYNLTMQFDFAADLMEGFYSLNGGSTTSLGSVAIDPLLTAQIVADTYGVASYANLGAFGVDNIELQAVPEPSTGVMVILGLSSLIFLRRFVRKSASA